MPGQGLPCSSIASAVPCAGSKRMRSFLPATVSTNSLRWFKARACQKLSLPRIRCSPEAHGHGKILGGGIVGTHAGDMIGEIALAIEMGADAVDIGKTIHPHPTLGVSIGMAAEIAHGSCTDVPPGKR